MKPIKLTQEEWETAIVRCFFGRANYILDKAIREMHEKYPNLFSSRK